MLSCFEMAASLEFQTDTYQPLFKIEGKQKSSGILVSRLTLKRKHKFGFLIFFSLKSLSGRHFQTRWWIKLASDLS